MAQTMLAIAIAAGLAPAAALSPAAIPGVVLVADGKWNPAQTEMDCRPYGGMAADLLERNGEVPVAAGVVGAPANGIRIVIFASPDGKSFTVAAVRWQDGQACLGNFGTSWVTGRQNITRLLMETPPPPPVKEPLP